MTSGICEICYQSTSKSTKVVFCNNCGQDFHRSCIAAGVATSNICPMCKSVFSETFSSSEVEQREEIQPSIPLSLKSKDHVTNPIELNNISSSDSFTKVLINVFVGITLFFLFVGTGINFLSMSVLLLVIVLALIMKKDAS